MYTLQIIRRHTLLKNTDSTTCADSPYAQGELKKITPDQRLCFPDIPCTYFPYPPEIGIEPPISRTPDIQIIPISRTPDIYRFPISRTPDIYRIHISRTPDIYRIPISRTPDIIDSLYPILPLCYIRKS